MKTVIQSLFILLLLTVTSNGQIMQMMHFPEQDEFSSHTESFLLGLHNNDMLMIWYDQENYEMKVSLSTDEGNSWLSASVLPSYFVSTEINAEFLSSGRIIVAFKSNRHYLVYSDDNGQTWSDAIVLPTRTNPAERSYVALSNLTKLSDGNAAFIYSYSGSADPSVPHRGIYAIYSSDGENWSAIQTIDPDGRYGHIINLNDSTDMLIYQDSTITDQYLFYRISTDGGTSWSNRSQLLSTSFNGSRVRGFKDDIGKIWLFYQEDDPTSFIGFTQSEIYFITSTDEGLNWSSPEKFTNYAGVDTNHSVSEWNGKPILSFTSSRNFQINKNFNQIYYGVGGETVDSSTPPYLYYFTANPDSPHVYEPIDFRAFVDDEAGLDSVFLVTTINVFNIDTLLMYDDGLHNDSLPGDNIYGVTFQKGINTGDNLRYDFLLKDIDGNYAGFNGSDIYIPLPFTTDAYRIEVNKLKMPLNNSGVFADVSINGMAGGWFDESTVLFSGGFFLSGKDGDEIWANAVASASRIQDYQPGIVGSNPDDPKNSLYIIKASDPPFGESWQNYKYAVQLGADFYDGDNDGIYNPVDLNGNSIWDLNEDRPDFFGDVTVWSVYNDGKPSELRRFNDISPMGIEIHQTVFAMGENLTGLIQNMMFIRYRIINKGTVSNEFDSSYFTVWADPDLGSANVAYLDDLTGCDTLLNFGYAYNDGEDNAYGSNPPSFGMPILQGSVVYIPGETFLDKNGNGIYEDSVDTPLDTAIVNNGLFIGSTVYPGAKNLAMTSFIHYMKLLGTLAAPNTALEARYYMLGGRNRLGGPIDPCNRTFGNIYGVPCNEVNPLFMYSGDPVTQFGWINTFPTDQRTMANTGPFTLKENEPVDVWTAYVVGRGNDALNSITKMRENIEYAHKFYKSNFSLLPTGIDDNRIIPQEHVLYQNYPNPFNPVTRIKFQLPQAGKVTIKIYDVLGAEVKILLNEERPAGTYEIDFNASRLASGVYFYQLKAGSPEGQTFVQIKKMVFLK